MQNKGIVKVFAVLLSLVCIFYLSFSFATRSQEAKIAEIAETQGAEAAEAYQDSVLNAPVWLWSYTLKQCREMEIGLGLDLKGGMNVILEVSVPDVVKALADHKTDADFIAAIDEAAKEAKKSQTDFITLFVKNYKATGKPLASIFATQQLRGKVNTNSSDAEVENVLRAEVQAAVDNSYNVLRTRIDRFGVAQPNIQTLEGQMGRIMVEMPGVKEPERVRKLLQGSANLEFWETYNTEEAVPFLAQLDSKLAEIAREDASAEEGAAEVDATTGATTQTDSTATDTVAVANDLASAIGSTDATPKDDASLAAAKKRNPLFAVLQPMQGAYGSVVGMCMGRDTAEVNKMITSAAAKEVLPTDMKLMWGVKASSRTNRGEVFELYAIRADRTNRAPLEGDVVVDAKDEFDQHGRPCVSMSMNTDGARRWAALTKANVKRSVAIVLDGLVYSAPTVQNEITGGNSQITGNFTIDDTKDLANVLKSGKMPAPARIVSEQIVGPSLGAESIRMGVISFAIGVVLLMLFMILIYGVKPGMVANCALLLNAFFTLGILTSFQAALTMSGIAGLVLTLGMAVDANVLIYERTKEELKGGKKVKEAINAGYSNAFSAIFDSNLTSILTGIILFNFGTGPIRGFATTYIIGILVSFFTAVFLTRLVYDRMMCKGKWQNLSFEGILGKWQSNGNWNFMGSYKTSLGVFVILGVLSIAGYVVRGFNQSIDFTGGRNIVVMFENPTEPEVVRGLLAEAFPEANNSAIAIGTDGKQMRISTNYKIEEDGIEVDGVIEKKLYETLAGANLLNADYEGFVNRDVREGGSIIESQKVGPSIARDITIGAIWSTLLALLVIALYIWIRFRNYSFAAGAIVALFFDTLLILGVYAWCWGVLPFSLEIDQTFIGAILTAIGYSINDKVVVFDRIREFLGLYPKRDRQQLFNTSLNTTLTRTIWTSVSTLIVLVVIFLLGADSIRSFAFAMILGVVIGTITSIFVAAPVAYLTHGNKIVEENK